MTQTVVVREQGRIVGQLEYRWVSPRTIHVTNLRCSTPRAIWHLKRHLYALPWAQIIFRREKIAQRDAANAWRHHWRWAHAFAPSAS